MGWTISHGTEANGLISPSYRSISVLDQHLAYVLPARDWRSMAPAFGKRSGDPFTVPAAKAAHIAGLLRVAAGHRLMPFHRAALARELADAADRAAFANQPWEWR